MCMAGAIGAMRKKGVKSGGLLGAVFNKKGKPLGRNENSSILGRNRALGGGELDENGSTATLLGGIKGQGASSTGRSIGGSSTGYTGGNTGRGRTGGGINSRLPTYDTF